MSLLKVNKVSPQSGTDFTLGDSGDTFTVPSGATLTVAGTFTQTGAQTFDGGVDIDNFNINGTTITLSSGDMTLDVAGDIILDADGGDVFVKDAGTTFGSLTNTSGNLIIKSGTTTAATFSGANVTLAGTVASGAITSSAGLVIADAGNIGSASDTDAIAIAADGVVTFSQVPLLPDNTVATADIQADAITGAKIADNAINSEHYTDGSIDTAHIADAQITAAKLASGVGGITGADEWRVTANFSGDAAPITSNWERNDVHSSYIGNGMTESSGVFTFPSTGIWLIQAIGTFSNNTASSHYCGLYIRTTINNGGAFSGIAASTQGIFRGDSNNYYANGYCSALFDVTNVTNCKASLQVDHQQNDTINYGSTNSQVTGISFIRLGDT